MQNYANGDKSSQVKLNFISDIRIHNYKKYNFQ